MKDKIELVCISCPRGCNLTVNGDEVSGHYCKRGIEYAKAETTNPVRVLTCLMRAEGRQKPISVKTDKPVPKALLLECAKAIYEVHPKLPVACGDVLIENILGTGSNVISTCDAE
ncbi:MAG: DUF1667 domain-containing protein [Firmicutes bacterium]|nr:DUF1667 domain-containing protein [Bacillota bacterium]